MYWEIREWYTLRSGRPVPEIHPTHPVAFMNSFFSSVVHGVMSVMGWVIGVQFQIVALQAALLAQQEIKR